MNLTGDRIQNAGRIRCGIFKISMNNSDIHVSPPFCMIETDVFWDSCKRLHFGDVGELGSRKVDKK